MRCGVKASDLESAADKVLIIDDEEPIRHLCSRIVTSAGMEAHAAADGDEGMRLVDALAPSYVFLDVNLPGRNGMELLKEIRSRFPATRVVMVTGYASVDRAVSAMKLGAYDYVTKPFSPGRLRDLLAMEPPAPGPAAGRTSETPKRFGKIVGVSSAMQRIYDVIERSGRSDSTVLIEGESGTGKELVARALHACSGRAEEPFVPVNCGAIPATLIESELFGHVTGAFTDAKRASIGLLRSAGKGSVFLDEIGELGAGVQVKLLRALQEMEVRPVGGTETLPFHARIIAATNRDLGEEVDRGAFRRDLFYRLHVIPIFVPPLRERREDIPVLVEHFLRLQGNREGREMGISVDALRHFMRYPWPGNVRELENIVQRAYALLDHELISERDLELLFPRRGRERGGARQERTAGASSAGGSLLADTEREAIIAALRAAGGNKRRAARDLGIGIATLYRKIKKYAI